MKKSKTEILDPEVDDLCAILAQTLLRLPKETEDGKRKHVKKNHRAGGRHPPEEPSPSSNG